MAVAADKREETSILLPWCMKAKRCINWVSKPKSESEVKRAASPLNAWKDLQLCLWPGRLDLNKELSYAHTTEL